MSSIPIVICADSYINLKSQLSQYHPYDLYVQAGVNYDTEIAKLASINDPDITKSLIFASYRTLQDKLSQAHTGFANETKYLRSIGVISVMYNSEGTACPTATAQSTPCDEIGNLSSTDPQTNSVAIFTTTAHTYGFKSNWGPTKGKRNNYKKYSSNNT